MDKFNVREHSLFGIIFTTGIVVIGIIVVWFFWLSHIEYTNDAYVSGNRVYLNALHEGFVTAIHTDDSFLVKKGQLVIQLNETDAKIALEKAKKELANTVRHICQLYHEVFQLKAEIEVRKRFLPKPDKISIIEQA